MFGILAENFHLDIVAVAVGFLGKLVILLIKSSAVPLILPAMLVESNL